MSGFGRKNDQKWSKADFQVSETILNGSVMMDKYTIHLSKSTECVTPRVGPNINYGLQLINGSILAHWLSQVYLINARC